MTQKEQLLIIDPPVKLVFKGRSTQTITSLLRLTNPTDRSICFKITTKAVSHYNVTPPFGTLRPGETCNVAIIQLPTEETIKKAKFLIESVYAPQSGSYTLSKVFEENASKVTSSKVEAVEKVSDNDDSAWENTSEELPSWKFSKCDSERENEKRKSAQDGTANANGSTSPIEDAIPFKKRREEFDEDTTELFIRDNIYRSLALFSTEHLSLAEMKAALSKATAKELSESDNVIVGRLYVKALLECWIKDISKTIQNCIDENNFDVLNMIRSVNDFEDISLPFTQAILEELQKNKQLITEKERRDAIQAFKNRCLQVALDGNEALAEEVRFLELIPLFLDDYDKPEEVLKDVVVLEKDKQRHEFIKLINGMVRRVLDGTKFMTLLKNIENLPNDNRNEQLKAIKRAVEPLIARGKQMMIIKDFEDILTPYANPPQIKKKTVDGKKIVEVVGNVYFLSEVLPEVEEILKEKKIEEVHFVSYRILKIDADLQQSTWHGINIAVVAKKVKMIGFVTWDVSGKDATEKKLSKAGAHSNGNGINGQDGFAGESGGNVTLSVEQIENAKKFKIVSNGGSGSDGQDGGDGVDGKNGTGITRSDLEKEFPPTAAFDWHSRMACVRTVVLAIAREVKTVKVAWWEHGTRGLNEQNALNDIHNYFIKHDESFALVHAPSVYLHVILHDNSEIIFAHESGGHIKWTNCQSYFVHHGAQSAMGGHGGERGKGGDRGYPGTISIRNDDVETMAQPGRAGADGKGGLQGKCGENGWDMGWLDFSVSWSLFTSDWPKYRGSSDDRYKAKLKLTYYEENTTERIYCPYNQSNMELNSFRLEEPKQRSIEERQNKETSREKNHNAKANRKNPINVNKMQSTYAEQQNAIEEVLRNIRKNCVKKESEVMEQIALQQEADQLHLLSKISRQAEYQRKNKTATRKPFFNKKRKRNAQTNANARRFNDEEEFLIEKFRTLQAIASDYRVPPPEENERSDLLQPKKVAPFLIEMEGGKFEKNFADLNALFQSTDANILSIYEKENAEMFETAMNKALDQCATEIGGDHGADASKDVKHLYQQFLATFKERKNVSIRFEFFSHFYSICVLVFATNDNSGILSEEYNSECVTNLPVLLVDDTLRPLTLDNPYLALTIERQNVDSTLGAILTDIDLLTTKEELKHYHKQKKYLNSDGKGRKGQKQFDEQSVISEIAKHFPDDEIQTKNRLELIGSYFTGTDTILRALHLRFKVEECHIEFDELTFLIISVLDSVINDRQELNIYEWIIVAHAQEKWIDEFVLLQLENNVRALLSKADDYRKQLNKIEDKGIGMLLIQKLQERAPASNHEKRHQAPKTIVEIDSILRLTQSSTTIQNLEAITLNDWHYVLKESFWMEQLRALTTWEDDEDNERLTTACYYLLTVENASGEQLVKELLNVLKTKKAAAVEIVKVLYNFYVEEWQISAELIEKFTKETISQWFNEESSKEGRGWGWGSSLVEWGTAMFHGDKGMKERKVEELLEIIKTNGKTSKNICESLDSLEQIVYKSEKTFNSQSKLSPSDTKRLISAFTSQDIKTWVTKLREQCSLTTEPQKTVDNHLDEILAVIDRAIELTRGFRLRDTQKLAVLLFHKTKQNILEQVSTGEGKSLIVATLAIIKVLSDEKVDIITSSTVLARRDAEENKDIYGLFDISVAHNCSEDFQKRSEAYTNHSVVYGEISSFQRDYLLDRFYSKNIIGNRNFENVIVDEVDSMLLDKGNNVLYLSHEIAGFDKLEAIYLFIWQIVNQPVASEAQFQYTFNTKIIKERVLDNMIKRIKVEDLRRIEETAATNIWNTLIEKKVISEEGWLLKDEVSDDIVRGLSLNERKQKQVLFLLDETARRQPSVLVPNFLKHFVVEHLEGWIDSAKTALYLKEGADYVIDVDRTGTNSDINPNVTILDLDTGTDQSSSQWENALHQFLQLKHGCKVSLQSLKAVFISNVSYFKEYMNLYGLTGTLGSQSESDLLKNIYKVDFVTIPTARKKQFTEEKPKLCVTKNEWMKCIVDEARRFTKEEQRSVLIICETIKTVEELHAYFEEQKISNVYAYKREHEEFGIAKNDLEGGAIIIATNLAGRGTDIKISSALRKAGGLHVCLTYLPTNKRVEEQAFGRAARSGHRGSGALIILEWNGAAYSGLKVINLRIERDRKEVQRVSEILSYYEEKIKAEEDCFWTFKGIYTELKNRLDARAYCDPDLIDKTKALLTNNDCKKIDHVIAALNVIRLQSCLDRWAFWLDKEQKVLNDDTSEKNKQISAKSLKKFVDDLAALNDDNWYQGYPYHAVKYARHLAAHSKDKDDKKRAIQIFDDVIKEEPVFSEAAHYYKAFALLKAYDWEKATERKEAQKIFKFELREAQKLFEMQNNEALQSSAVVNKLRENFITNGIIQINAYDTQKKKMREMFVHFVQSIDDILGPSVMAESLQSLAIDDEMANEAYKTLENVEKVIQRARVKKNISSKNLKKISHDYGIDIIILQNVVNGYQRRFIDERAFVKDITKSIVLPNKSEFWREALKAGIFLNETKFVLLDEEKLKEAFSSIQDDDLPKPVDRTEFLEALEKELTTVYLNVEQLQQLSETTRIYHKNAFKTTANAHLYEALKKNGIIKNTKKANVDITKTKIKYFEKFDSVTANDFLNEYIDEKEAHEILKALVKGQILETDTKNPKVYRLVGQIIDVRLPECPIYEDATKCVLMLRFSYRRALMRLERQIHEKSTHLKVPLIYKPHQSVFWDLVDNKVIKAVNVNKNSKDIEETIKSIYDEHIAIDKIKGILSDGMPQVKAAKIDKIIEHLFVKGSLMRASTEKHAVIASEKINVRLQDCDVLNETIRGLLKCQLRLRRKESYQSLAATMEHLKGTLKTVEVPDGSLESIVDVLNQNAFGLIDEINVLTLNGMDYLIRLEEKKWTTAMLWNTGVVAALGLLQIIAGFVITICSAGTMTHVGAGFVAEGIGDLMFAAGAMRSGYFSWKAYAEHKIWSVAFTIATAGIGAFLSRGAQVSRYARKIIEAGFETGGNDMTKLAGWALKNKVGWTRLLKHFGRDVGLNTLKGVTFGFAANEVERFVENHLRSFCEGISSTLLAEIDQKVTEHDIASTLRTVYTEVGSQKGRQLIQKLTREALNNKNFIEEHAAFFFRVGNSFVQGLRSALEKNRQDNIPANSLAIWTKRLGKVVIWSKRTANVNEIAMLTINFLDNLDKAIKEELKITSKARGTVQKDSVAYETFRDELVDEWRQTLKQRSGQLIAQKIVAPILHHGARELLNFVGRQIKYAYSDFKTELQFDEFERLQKEQHERLNEAKNSGDTSATEQITKEYHQKLYKLLRKVRSPKLFAAIIREGGPMDMVCAKAFAITLTKYLQETGNPNAGVILEIKGENGISQRIVCGNVDCATVIPLEVKDGHFTLAGEANILNTPSTGYDCFFEALAEKHPDLFSNITKDGFRGLIADCIETDKLLQETIEKGFHDFAISKGMYGGNRERSRSRSGGSPRPLNPLNSAAEAESKCVHARYPYNGAVDKDNRVVLNGRELTNDEKSEQLATACKDALDLSNKALDELYEKLGIRDEVRKAQQPLSADKFQVTTFAKLNTEKIGSDDCELFPVDMAAEHEVKFKAGNKEVVYRFRVEINIDNPGRNQGAGPLGPHVGYTATILKPPTGLKDTAVCGHVLVNENSYLPGRDTRNISKHEVDNMVKSGYEVPYNAQSVFKKQNIF
uniref:Chloroplast protein-transporting ATPase n=1 Tax=Plectus sambesii TaxID=2011161 RepID=A0A914VT58_9BILA